MTTRTLGVIMDPIEDIAPSKDSTLAILLAAQKRGWSIEYMTLSDLHYREGAVFGRVQRLEVQDSPVSWYTFVDEPKTMPLVQLDVLLMRKDPNFNMEYIYATYLLELAENLGLCVVNRPRALRDFNEKLAIARFPQCAPKSAVTKSEQQIRDFLDEHGVCVLKPLDGMGGSSVFKVKLDDPNTGSLIETMTMHGSRTVMVQKYIPDVLDGDKRVLLIDGKPFPYALARVPAAGEFRANLAVGATGHGVELSENDRRICNEVGPRLKDVGLLFVGLDIIGNYLTEINITSPTGIRELDKAYNFDIGSQIMAAVEKRLQSNKMPLV